MASVTQRIREIQQPRGGYLPIKSFEKVVFDDGVTLNESENIHASLVGMAVDYLTRFQMGASASEAFRISCLGACNLNMLSKAKKLISNVTGLDDLSIISACKLSGFDVCHRASVSAYKPVEHINPDSQTIENIRTMVNRSVSFWDKYGPIVCSEPTFEGGYTETVNTGDGDYLTENTLWDFKVSKSAPTSKHSLQLLMYYVMGLHSIHDHFKNLTYLGFFNPRLNIAYICPVSSISSDTIAEIENNVICYGGTSQPRPELYQEDANTVYLSDELTVTDICSLTGIKKSTIYADIRSGRLIANKKGNKYSIPLVEYQKYIKRIKLQKRISFVAAAVLFAFTLFILLKLRF